MVYRVVKRDEDLKAASETDVNVAGMGFKLSLEGVRAKYGEYWEPAAPKTPPLPQAGKVEPGPQEEEPAASFAEGAPPTAADILAGKLGDAGDGVQADWMARVKAMADAANSPEELRANIEAAWGLLPTGQLTRLIELALTAATLAGIYDARNEADDLPPSLQAGEGRGEGKG